MKLIASVAAIVSAIANPLVPCEALNAVSAEESWASDLE